MRKEYGKALRHQFAKAMKEKVPEFTEETVQTICLWPGQRAYSRRVSDSLRCWIVLSPRPKDYEEFTVLIGWSTFGRYPELEVIPSALAPSPERTEFCKTEYLIRLPQLWTAKDLWWVIQPFEPALTVEQMMAAAQPVPAQAAEAKVFPCVQDAMSKILDMGLPYLAEFICSRESEGRG